MGICFSPFPGGSKVSIGHNNNQKVQKQQVHCRKLIVVGLDLTYEPECLRSVPSEEKWNSPIRSKRRHLISLPHTTSDRERASNSTGWERRPSALSLLDVAAYPVRAYFSRKAYQIQSGGWGKVWGRETHLGHWCRTDRKGLAQVHCFELHPNCEEMASQICMILQGNRYKYWTRWYCKSAR